MVQAAGFGATAEGNQLTCSIEKELVPAEAVVAALQPFLPNYAAEVESDGGLFRITLTPKDAGTPEVDSAEFVNELFQVAFRCRLRTDTVELRRMILDRAFAVYTQEPK